MDRAGNNHPEWGHPDLENKYSFLSVCISLESLDMCVLLGIPIEIRQ